MKFNFGHEIILPSVPIDVAFERLTSAAHVEQVVRLSGFVSEFELLSDEGDTLHFRFVDNISVLAGAVKKRLTIEVKQTRDTTKKTLVYESDVDHGIVTVVKLRSFTPTEEGGTLITETVDGQCLTLFQPIAKKQGHKELIEHMNRYHTLFNEMQT